MNPTSANDNVEAVFATAAFQFCGHVDEYLIRHVRQVGILYMQTRYGKGNHLFRRYEDGRLVEEYSLRSSHSLLGFYLLWLWHWHRELTRFCRGRKNVLALYQHPLGSVGTSLRPKARHIFWQWDYFPGHRPTERLFDVVAQHGVRNCFRYHPLTGALGKAMGASQAEPIMLGVTPPTRFGCVDSNRILVVGQLRHGQGVENVLDFIATHPTYQLSLIGASVGSFGPEITQRIEATHIADRVYFPDRFVSDAELREEAAKCFVSLALYDTSPNNLTHYADPGKVKSSIEMGLPVVMTRISEIVSFVERFKAGEVIDSLDELSGAIERIRDNYAAYQEGLRAFAAYFDCESYYKNLLR